MKNNLQHTINKMKQNKASILVICALSFCFFALAQVKTSVDSTSIKIGEQITYKIELEVDTTRVAIFPEGQSFVPLEMIESYAIDTTKKDAKYNLIKKYGLTQFDSGTYTIPRQKIIIGDKILFSDSLNVEVKNIVVDTTKQKLYDIKSIMTVEKSVGNWWKYLLIALAIIGLVSFLLYWFIWHKKPLSEDEKIALLPPYDRAKLALKTLDNSDYLQNEELKEYYSELTFIIRKYLDEKVYDRALESTTDELVNRLNLLKEGNQIDLSKDDIRNIETILKRADLVKFAKSAPDVALAEIDRKTIDIEIDQVKEALPEPTEEEKLLNQQYKEEQERKTKRNKIILTVGIAVFLLFATLAGFVFKYGFSYVKDTIIGHESKALLENQWVTSEYGVPPLTISTPNVLKRIETPIPDEVKGKITNTTFAYGTLASLFSITVNTTVINNQGESKLDLESISEASLKQLEASGAKDIVVLRDKFSTPNGAEGLKTYGTLKIKTLGTEDYKEAQFTILQFASENVLQQVILSYPNEDTYADQIVERIINSIELKSIED